MSPNRDQPRHTRLYRSRERRVIAGVCAGIAEYFGVSVAKVRLLALLALLFFPPMVMLSYLGLTLLLPLEPRQLYRSEAEHAFWREVRVAPRTQLKNLSHRYRQIEARIRALEAHVTSPGFRMDRELGR
ncbi:MAG TPA: envelope stress response membrane protein PspC [Candidatus Competibacteraceae bacterium]|nr:envelope stress response membrane protein PspC [Candidatus Competibacteraceae bacterium]